MDSTLSHLSHLLIRHLTAGGAHASVSDAHALAGDAHALAETQRLVQMTAINVFSIHHAVDSHVGKYCTCIHTNAIKINFRDSYNIVWF